jgi:hypothetical protein
MPYLILTVYDHGLEIIPVVPLYPAALDPHKGAAGLFARALQGQKTVRLLFGGGHIRDVLDDHIMTVAGLKIGMFHDPIV